MITRVALGRHYDFVALFRLFGAEDQSAVLQVSGFEFAVILGKDDRYLDGRPIRDILRLYEPFVAVLLGVQGLFFSVASGKGIFDGAFLEAFALVRSQRKGISCRVSGSPGGVYGSLSGLFQKDHVPGRPARRCRGRVSGFAAFRSKYKFHVDRGAVFSPDHSVIAGKLHIKCIVLFTDQILMQGLVFSKPVGVRVDHADQFVIRVGFYLKCDFFIVFAGCPGHCSALVSGGFHGKPGAGHIRRLYISFIFDFFRLRIRCLCGGFGDGFAVRGSRRFDQSLRVDGHAAARLNGSFPKVHDGVVGIQDD